MTSKEAWEILKENLPDNAGYEGSELEECSEYIAKYNKAIRGIDALVKAGHDDSYLKILF